MSLYLLLRFAHVAGAILLGGGLLAVFISEWRAMRVRDLARFAEAAWYTAVFYDALVLPGALLAAASGLIMALELELGFLSEPWLVGMWGLFVFEFVEGNTVTRIQFRRTLRLSAQAEREGRALAPARAEARTTPGQVAHFLDLPLYGVMVWCGMIRPDRWSDLALALLVGIAVAAVLSVAVPRLARTAPTTS